MDSHSSPPLGRRIKTLVIGGARSLHDRRMFHRLSLAAFLAWVGLGADGLSSSCYGPEEAFRALGDHHSLGLFVALATGLTIFVISSSYSHIIEAFPAGGGGYVVASKLLSPRLGMLAGCALLVDYVLTIAVSIAAGADALFSFFPAAWQQYKLAAAVAGMLALALLNLRGIRESVAPLVPIFVTFVLSHAFMVVYALVVHVGDFGQASSAAVQDFQRAHAQLGLGGIVSLVFFAYAMGAGTYTGIEAVSNGLPVLREPRVQTGKRTMTYMWVSLATLVVGLMVAYLLYRVTAVEGKTLNAVLVDRLTAGWGPVWGRSFVFVVLFSEAALLFVAAQTGYLGGPRIMANMALDRWLPSRFSMLSDRLVTQNGVLLIGAAALAALLLTGGAVDVLVVLYSINVFITFLLSQTGMVRHWWRERGAEAHWRKRLTVNAVGAALTLLILVWVIGQKFHLGGWVTLVVTAGLVVLVSLIRRHYDAIRPLAERLNTLTTVMPVVRDELAASAPAEPPTAPPFDPQAKTAILLVGGFNGFGMHTLLNVIRLFGDSFRNFVFVHVGVIDAGNFKGHAEVERLQKHARDEADRYVQFVRAHGRYAEGFATIGTDVADEVARHAPDLARKFPQAVFFAGRLIFPQDSVWTRWLHNNLVFAVQRRLSYQGIPFVILPIRA
jgi:amino acid transporter